MKTTVDISDSLLEEAKNIASKDHTTVRALVELGLRRVLADRKRDRAFRLRRASFKGEGLQAGVADAGWERIREIIYENHGA